MRKLGRFDDFVNGFALAGRTGGVGQHGDAGFDAEDTGGMRRADGDVRKLAGCGVRIDRAVAEHKDAILEAHEEQTMEVSGFVLMISKAGRMVWAVVFTAPETMPSASPI